MKDRMEEKNGIYLVFDEGYGAGTGCDAFLGASYDFQEACAIALKRGVASVYVLIGVQLSKVVYLSGSKWIFYEASPYDPFKFKDGEAVRYNDDQVGNIAYGMLFDYRKKRSPPPFDTSDSKIEIIYLVGEDLVEESDIEALHLKKKGRS